MPTTESGAHDARVIVRRARVEDAAGIARVHVQGWREAYTGRIPQRILDRLDIERFTHVRAEVLRGERPSEHTDLWVAVVADEIVGFASSGPSRDDDTPPGSIELGAIYVIASHYGTGAGQALLDAAIGRLPATLWVLEDNPRARAFYARNGFVPDGESKDDDRWGDPLHEIRLARS